MEALSLPYLALSVLTFVGGFVFLVFKPEAFDRDEPPPGSPRRPRIRRRR